MSANTQISKETVATVLAERVRPRLQAHGGDIHLLDIVGTIVRLKVSGACQSCPSLNDTIEEVILQTLQERLEVPSLKVEVDRGVSQDLIHEALKIIRR
ncbi:MAG: NifU family protein [Bacteroidales bacterium]|uniref:NifU family protein n=1 Tax=Porphyromonas sp. TaxID=1924944 RepID=UPI00297B9C38|nr:NifU family protein [Porphyromonas sp.]MDD7438300.1 NifU family protein [Bacteroidales bacterium]MDY3066725.1 NifU family protein [Porphyromonas sp.]